MRYAVRSGLTRGRKPPRGAVYLTSYPRTSGSSGRPRWLLAVVCGERDTPVQKFASREAGFRKKLTHRYAILPGRGLAARAEGGEAAGLGGEAARRGSPCGEAAALFAAKPQLSPRRRRGSWVTERSGWEKG